MSVSVEERGVGLGLGRGQGGRESMDSVGTVGTEESRASALEVHLGMRVGKGGGE